MINFDHEPKEPKMKQITLTVNVDYNELTTDATIVDHMYHIIQLGLESDRTTPIVHVEIVE